MIQTCPDDAACLTLFLIDRNKKAGGFSPSSFMAPLSLFRIGAHLPNTLNSFGMSI